MQPENDSAAAPTHNLACDLLVVGSGVAGLMTALYASRYCHVVLATKAELEDGSTRYAQGGIAFAIGDKDSTELHLQDTLTAGAGLCDREAVDLLVNEGVDCFLELVSLGARFDHSGEEVSLHREGGHSRARIVHAGDATGMEIVRTLRPLLRDNANVRILEHCFMEDLLVEGGVCRGARFLSGQTVLEVWADATVLASGGAGQLFRLTTNPRVGTGDGIAVAARAGVRLADLEFIQFHPTALYGKENPLFLISEAVRGEGALLLDDRGERFMLGVHPLAELAPRDVVVRTMFRRMRELGTDHVYLDLRAIARDKLENEFPTIYDRLKEEGMNIHHDLIPISFAAHYTIGGVVTDLNGRTSLRGLYACGEVSRTGVHGANRLASNSLLEALVFSRRIAQHAREIITFSPSFMEAELPPFETAPEDINAETLHHQLSEEMMDLVGVFRSAEGLQKMLGRLETMDAQVLYFPRTIAIQELQNMLEVARLICTAALERLESRGTHQREDYPDQVPAWAERHTIFEGSAREIVAKPAEGIEW